jgi:DNA repair exonuclease SbcCD ATPase subunit
LGRCAWTSSPSSCELRTASAAATAIWPAHACAKQIAEPDRKIQAQVQALEKGIEPELVSERIAELRGEKQALEDAVAEIGAENQEAEDEELTAQLARLPDLAQALREAPPAIKRQVFTSFDLQIAYDKVKRRVELTATVAEAVADAFENAKALQAERSSVVPTDIAGAGFEPATSGYEMPRDVLSTPLADAQAR